MERNNGLAFEEFFQHIPAIDKNICISFIWSWLQGMSIIEVSFIQTRGQP